MMRTSYMMMVVALAAPLLLCGAVTNWTDSATYADVIAARRAGRPAPQPRPAPVARIVGRRNGQILVETRYPLGGVTTNARTPHLIYRAAQVATNAHAARAYDAALARLATSLAVADEDAAAAQSREPAALHRQAARINREAERVERGKGGLGKSAGIAGGAIVAAAAAYAVGRKVRTA